MYTEDRFLGGWEWAGSHGAYVDRSEGDTLRFSGREGIWVDWVEAYGLVYWGGVVRGVTPIELLLLHCLDHGQLPLRVQFVCLVFFNSISQNCFDVFEKCLPGVQFLLDQRIVLACNDVPFNGSG